MTIPRAISRRLTSGFVLDDGCLREASYRKCMKEVVWLRASISHEGVGVAVFCNSEMMGCLKRLNSAHDCAKS